MSTSKNRERLRLEEKTTRSPEETQKFGEEIGKLLQAGDIVGITGELGAGKTCLAQGIGRGLGIKPGSYLTSPSFTLIKEYPGRVPLYHIDLYRMNSIDEVLELGYEEYLYGEGVTLIEWAERISSLLPPGRILIKIEILSKNERRIIFLP